MHGGTANQCTFTGNSTESNDGGGMCYGIANDCTFSGNKSEDDGAGMYYGIANDCRFLGNSSYYYAGGLCYGTANNCIFIGNWSEDAGGGMYYGTANHCVFSGNNSDYEGGAMSGSTANHCTFSNNYAYYDGGGIYDGTANHCTFIDNKTYDQDGGGMSYGTANHCSFIDNYADESGGGMYAGTASNCTFSGNRAGSGYGGGLRNSTANGCTIVGNRSYSGGGGMYGGTAYNCIIWSNSVNGSDGDLGGTTAYASCSPDVGHGSNGNITNAPLFITNVSRRFRLAGSSPCMDAGSNAYVSAATDLAGNPRILNGVVDMGAYERPHSPWIASSLSEISVSVAAGHVPPDASFELWNEGMSNMPYSLSCNVPWLTVLPSTGDSTHEEDIVTCEFDTSTLAVGSYEGTITVSAPLAANSPQSVAVTLDVYEPVLDHFEWTPLGLAYTAGESFDVMIHARDEDGYAVTSFAGTVAISGSTGAPPEVVIGAGTSEWDFPMDTSYDDARTQVIYLDSELPGPGLISSLALNVTTLPRQVMNNWTIRMRHTTLDSYPASPSWEDTWTTVHQSAANVSSLGWVEFKFATPFEYNGTDNLMVDFCFNNGSYTDDGLCLSTNTGTDRVLYYESDSDDGNPLTWTGSDPTPDVAQTVPSIRLHLSREESIPVAPTATDAFAGGTWSGSVTVPDPYEYVQLRVYDDAWHGGYSSAFRVYSPGYDGDGDGIPDVWETFHFGHPTNCVPTGNADGDAHNNEEESITGMDPNDADSCFGITSAASVVDGFVIEWPSFTNRLYTVTWEPDLTNGFQILQGGIEFPQNSYTDTVHHTDSKAFHRVRVQMK